MIRKRKGEKVLRPVHPNAGIRAAYRRKMSALIQEMAASYHYWLKACWRKNEPAMTLAQDSAASDLERQLGRLFRYWGKRFDEAAPKLAEWFAQASHKRSQDALRKILRDAGISVEFKMNRPMRDAIDATIAENVSLIKSIQSQYHTQVQGLVMRSVTAGRDLSSLTAELEKRYGITHRRAAFIALDQNNKSTSAMMAARQTSLGIEEGVWLHSHAGKTPRPSHVRNDGKRFSIRTGWPDPALKGKLIWPGTEPGCRCSWRVVVKGFS